MKITNPSGLPDVIVRMAQADTDKHKPMDGVLSVTELVSSPRIYQLNKRHDERMEDDVQERIDMLFGTAWHKALEEHKSEDELAEQRYFHDMEPCRISGQVDLYDPKTQTITDHKTAKVYSYLLGDNKNYQQQLNCYAYILSKNGLPVKRIVLFWTFKDWSWRTAAKDPDYPQKKSLVQEIKLWTMDEAETFIKERLSMHVAQNDTPDDELPECTAEDMWERPLTFAVMKYKNVRALRVLDSKNAADKWIDEQNIATGLRVEERPGERVKCEQFCVISKNGLCNQYKKYKEAKDGTR